MKITILEKAAVVAIIVIFIGMICLSIALVQTLTAISHEIEKGGVKSVINRIWEGNGK